MNSIPQNFFLLNISFFLKIFFNYYLGTKVQRQKKVQHPLKGGVVKKNEKKFFLRAKAPPASGGNPAHSSAGTILY
jgi:hypothetical protein